MLGKKRTRPAATPVALKDWVDKFHAKLTELDPSAWSEEEKAGFTASITELKKTILALLKK